MQYQAKTQNGYNLMETISALQKEIRRGHEELYGGQGNWGWLDDEERQWIRDFNKKGNSALGR